MSGATPALAPGLTLAREVEWAGIGLHTGQRARARICPARRGIVFERRDLAGAPRVSACVATALAGTVGRHTVLERDGVRVATVEHVLSVLSALGITAARIVLEGEEVPDAGDGSVAELAAWIDAAGVAPALPGPPALEPAEVFRFRDGNAHFEVAPARGLSVEYLFDHPHPHLGRQEFGLEVSRARFIADIAPARTFATLEEVEGLRDRGLARGGSLDNAVVVGPEGPLGEAGWRFPGEAVRHKVLDFLGDLSLLGRPLHARVRAERSGHRSNVRFAAALEDAFGATAPDPVD